MSPILKAKGKAPGLYDDEDFVCEVILSLLREGTNVILAASSYGGAVAFEACKGITTKEREGASLRGEVKHLVLLAVLLAEPGITVKDLLGDQLPVDIDGFTSDNTHLPAIDVGRAGAALCGSLPKEEQEHYAAIGTAIGAKAFVELMSFAAWKEVPTTLLIGDEDLALTPALQHDYFDKVVKKGVKGLRKVVIEGGDHLTTLSHSQEVSKVCLKAAAEPEEYRESMCMLLMRRLGCVRSDRRNS